MKKKLGLIILSIMFVMPGNGYILPYDYECGWSTTYGGNTSSYRIDYNGSQCGSSSDWTSYKLINGQWTVLSTSSSYGSINLMDFSCCGIA